MCLCDGMDERTDGRTLTTVKDIVPVSVIDRCIL